MLLMLWFLAQLFVVLAMAVLGPHLPQSPLEIVVLLVVGVAVLLPLVDRLLGGLRVVLSVGTHGPPALSAVGTVIEVDLPAAPGSPGTPLVRAPAHGAPRFA